jgi:foldase protein PrsA
VKKMMRWFTALGAFFVLAICLAACGGSGKSSNGVSASDVAVVAGNPISVQAFNHWMYVAEKGNAVEDGGPVIVPTDPPQFNGCIKQVRAQIPTYKNTAAKTLRTDCKELFTELSSQVMDFLIKAYWYQGTAYLDKITVTQAEIAKAFKAAQKSTFPTNKEYKAFLAETGETIQDIDFRLRVNTVYQKLITKHVPKITTAAERAYYAAHLSQFETPATASVKVIQTADTSKGKTAIDAAKAALKSGESFAAVAKKYSTSTTTKSTGGVFKNYENNDLEAAVNKVIFSARLNKLKGPIKGTFGYYLVEVTKRTATVKSSFAKEKAEIKELLTSQSQTSAETKVNAAAKKQWGAETKCRAVYLMDDCAGYVAPKTTTSTTPAAGATVAQSTGTAAVQTSTTPASTQTSTTPASTTTTG